MSVIGNNIKALRTLKGSGREITQQEIADIAGVTRETVNKWESGAIGNIRDSNIQRLRDYFNLTIDDLRSESAGLAAQLTDSAPVLPHGALTPVASPPAYAPLLGRVHAGDAQEPDVLDDEIPLPANVLAGHPHAYFLQVEGQCMSRVYPEGCFILIDPDKPPTNGSIAVVSIDGADYVMRRLYRGASTLVLSPDSWDDGFEDIVLRDIDEHSVEFHGTVVWFQASREME
ncbi:LexA family transcriptional regulator [uncultured Olegusella sp.]|uniref:LexA family protein n=1 Tax=uncultured Olegusella sp. TaxID=1979846 RepID=UPI00260E9E57|nr:XRE family transcriptional regulator [uncultured Olegusella sp.]